MGRSVLRLLMVAILCTVLASGLAAGPKRTITFLTAPWGVPPDKGLLTAFTQNSGVDVQITSAPSAELYSKVQVASTARRAPADVIFLTEEAPSFLVAPGYMEPLDGYLARSPDLNVADIDRLNFWTVGGKVQGVTTYVQLVMMDYNTKRFQAGGLRTPPSTWDELRQQALQLKSKGVDTYPISFGAIDWSWYLMSLSSGDPMFDTGLNPVFNKPGSPARRAMAMLVHFFTTDHVITPDLLTKVTPHDVFMGGIGVFHQAWQGSLAVMNNAKISKQAPDVRYLLLPEQHFTWSLDAAIGLSRFSRNKDAGWEFIKWYVSPENQRAIFTAVGLVPSRKSVQEALGKEGAIQDFNVMVSQAQYVRQLPRYAKWWGPWTQSVTEAVRKAAQGQITPDAAIDEAARRWSELKTQYKQ